MQVAGKRITKYGLALLTIVLIGLVLRVSYLGTQSIWDDEAFSVWISHLSLAQMVQTTGADVHPPLYYLMLHYWVALFGTSEVPVRLLSVLFGVLAIPIIYLLGRLLFKEEVALLAALILALSGFNIQYSQEARMYSLMVLLALLSMYFFVRFLQRNTVAISVGYVFFTTLLLYTHLYGVFVVIAQNVYVLTLLFLSREHAFRLRHWIAFQALLVAFFAPWIRVLLSQISSVEKGHLYWMPIPTINDLFITLHVYSGTIMLSGVFFLALAVLSLFTYRKVRGEMRWKAPVEALKSYALEVSFTKDYKPLYLLAVWLLAINVIPFVISLFLSPVYLTRYAIAGSAAFYLLVARGTSNINHRYTKVAVIGLVVALSVANLQVYYTSKTKPEAREATRFIDANAKSGDVVLISPDVEHITFDYYNNRTDVAIKPIRSWAVIDNPIDASAAPSVNRPEDKINEIRSAVTGHDRVWFFDAHVGGGMPAENFTLAILNESYQNVRQISYLGYDVYMFEQRA